MFSDLLIYLVLLTLETYSRRTHMCSALQRQKTVTDKSIKLRKMTLKFFVVSTQMYGRGLGPLKKKKKIRGEKIVFFVENVRNQKKNKNPPLLLFLLLVSEKC